MKCDQLSFKQPDPRPPAPRSGRTRLEEVWRDAGCSRSRSSNGPTPWWLSWRLRLAALLVCAIGTAGHVQAGSTDRARIYVVDTGNSRIVRIDEMAGTGWTAIGRRGSGVSEFRNPEGIFVERSGRVYVADTENHRVVRFDDMIGTGWRSLGRRGEEAREFWNPAGVYVRAGRIYVADSENDRVVRMDDIVGTRWSTLGTPRKPPPGFTGGISIPFKLYPRGIFVDAAGRIYVLDAFNDRIVRFNDMSGRRRTSLGTSGEGVREFSEPTGIFVDAAGRIYVADSGNHRIVRMDDLSGAGWRSLGRQGSGMREFWYPRGIAVDLTGRIYVADSWNGRIVRMNDITGAGWTVFGSRGAGNGQFSLPGAIFIQTRTR